MNKISLDLRTQDHLLLIQEDIDNNGFSCFSVPHSDRHIAESLKKINISSSRKKTISQERNEMIPATRFPLGALKVAYYRIKNIICNTKYRKEWRLDNDTSKLQIINVMPGRNDEFKGENLSQKITIFFVAHVQSGVYAFESVYNGKVKSRVPIQSGSAIMINPEAENFNFRIGKKKKSDSQILILKIEFIKKEKKSRNLNALKTKTYSSIKTFI